MSKFPALLATALVLIAVAFTVEANRATSHPVVQAYIGAGVIGFVAGALVGFIIGWLIGKVLGATLWFAVSCAALGVIVIAVVP